MAYRMTDEERKAAARQRQRRYALRKGLAAHPRFPDVVEPGLPEHHIHRPDRDRSDARTRPFVPGVIAYTLLGASWR